MSDLPGCMLRFYFDGPHVTTAKIENHFLKVNSQPELVFDSHHSLISTATTVIYLTCVVESSPFLSLVVSSWSQKKSQGKIIVSEGPHNPQSNESIIMISLEYLEDTVLCFIPHTHPKYWNVMFFGTVRNGEEKRINRRSEEDERRKERRNWGGKD